MRAEPNTATQGPRKCSARIPFTTPTTTRKRKAASHLRECGPSRKRSSSILPKVKNRFTAASSLAGGLLSGPRLPHKGGEVRLLHGAWDQPVAHDEGGRPPDVESLGEGVGLLDDLLDLGRGHVLLQPIGVEPDRGGRLEDLRLAEGAA